MKRTKKLCFSGVDIYIGLDVHKKNWTVSIWVNGRWSGRFISWLEQIEMTRPTGKLALQLYIDELKRYRTSIAFINHEIKKLAMTDTYKERV